MDEVIFRSSQKLENVQVQVALAASRSKEAIELYSEQCKSLIQQAWTSPRTVHIKEYLKDLWVLITDVSSDLQEKTVTFLNRNLVQLLWGKWSKRDISCMCIGFVAGVCTGMVVLIAIKRTGPVPHYMQAVQCVHYMGVESVQVVEDAIAPFECDNDKILINVKAASVHEIDAEICNGYGRTLRRILHRLHRQSISKTGLPITLGRDCTGIVTDIGPNVKRLEIGDEVWLSVPFWSQGTLSQSVLAEENKVGRKPRSAGFEGGSSLPYAGTLALDVLKKSNLSQENACNKRILIQGGCTPVGCVLIQILKHWNAQITTSCYKKAEPVAKALGANDIITLNKETQTQFLLKELELRDLYNVIINTKECGLTNSQFRKYIDKEGIVLSTLPQSLSSDNCNFFTSFLLETYIKFRFYLERILGLPLKDFDEAHMCYVSLDSLADMVEKGHLQTVVDKVFHPHDIEIALNHIRSIDSIGSTVITFR